MGRASREASELVWPERRVQRGEAVLGYPQLHVVYRGDSKTEREKEEGARASCEFVSERLPSELGVSTREYDLLMALNGASRSELSDSFSDVLLYR